MVKKLRKKFILTAMGALSLILAVLIVAINLANLHRMNRMADETLLGLEASGGMPSAPDKNKDRGRREDFDPGRVIGLLPGRGDADLTYSRDMERPFNTRYFSVSFLPDEAGGFLADTVDADHIAALTKEEAASYAGEVLSREKITQETLAQKTPDADGVLAAHSGNIGTYRYLLRGYEDASGRTVRVFFVDRASDIFQARQLLRISLVIGLLALLAMLLLVLLFSGFAVRPVVESLEKQKRFITDAGHELKTPLAVISADVDVMELEGGQSEWTVAIRSQVKRMTELVGNLLTISRMEEEVLPQSFQRVDFSALLTKCRDTFSAVAEDKQIGCDMRTDEGIAVMGDAEALTRLCTLLLDNAFQYCRADGTVTLSLTGQKGQAVLTLKNPCESLPEGNPDRLFDRFYRGEGSRSRKSGGFGIGLSAARSIAEAHGGTIRANFTDTRDICFTVKLPLAQERA